ncbi:hypothetical protein [Maribacter dokdonensis]|uniref:hypothetical protein n=1 Tax=Maribacter dokdonensis TaxID=320912 RepID=UPI00389943C2
MNKKILLWSITAALAGFLFGFDVVVISGADKNYRNYGNRQILFMVGWLWVWHFGVL